jgi:hypothetical protein
MRVGLNRVGGSWVAIEPVVQGRVAAGKLTVINELRILVEALRRFRIVVKKILETAEVTFAHVGSLLAVGRSTCAITLQVFVGICS